MSDQEAELSAVLEERFGVRLEAPLPEGADITALSRLAAHRVHRAYDPRPVDPALVRLLCACALSAPSKSDLQQRDIIVVSDRSIQMRIADLLPHMPWVRQAPNFLVICINGRRVPEISRWKQKPFPNDHFDLLFNGIGDAAIALAWLLACAEAMGLGGCPISEIRNHAAQVSEWLGLPDRMLPFVGFCLGVPAAEGQISPRLPLDVTVHENSFGEEELREKITAYDRRREQLQPFAEQRDVHLWGSLPEYGWSEQKARQYAVPQRGDFGDFVRRQGFDMS